MAKKNNAKRRQRRKLRAHAQKLGLRPDDFAVGRKRRRVDSKEMRDYRAAQHAGPTKEALQRAEERRKAGKRGDTIARMVKNGTLTPEQERAAHQIEQAWLLIAGDVGHVCMRWDQSARTSATDVQSEHEKQLISHYLKWWRTVEAHRRAAMRLHGKRRYLGAVLLSILLDGLSCEEAAKQHHLRGKDARQSVDDCLRLWLGD